MAVNSHIQIPNCILKNFRSPQSGKVFYLNLDTGHIGACGSASLGTELGYYSDEMEQYLNKEIELPFSRLTAEVISFVSEEKEKLNLPVEVETSFKKYITASMARSKFVLDIFMKGSFTSALVDMQTNHGDVVFISTKKNEGIHPSIQNHKMKVIVNSTNWQFVVPRNCFYSVRRGNTNTVWIIAPISPLCVLALAPEDYYASTEEGILYQIKDQNEIIEMNKHALAYEYAFNKAFVAAADKKELELLQKYYNGNHEYLDSLKKALFK